MTQPQNPAAGVKGPTDAMEPGDLAQRIGCSFLWHSQQAERIAREEISLIVVAPMLNASILHELHRLGCEAAQHEPGVFRVSGAPFITWMAETDTARSLRCNTRIPSTSARWKRNWKPHWRQFR